jgi:hypothetical protein
MVEEVLKSKNSLTVLNRMNHSNQTSIFSPECLQGKALMHSIRAFFMFALVLGSQFDFKSSPEGKRLGFQKMINKPSTKSIKFV